jgi:signal transduction histidine kinase/CheY-like chemotaxis protein
MKKGPVSPIFLAILRADPGSDQDDIAHRAFSGVLLGLGVVMTGFAALRLARVEIVPAVVDLLIAAIFLGSFVIHRRGHLAAAMALSLLGGGIALHAHLFAILLFDHASGNVQPNLLLVSVTNILLAAYIANSRRLLVVISAYAGAFHVGNILRAVVTGNTDPVFMMSTVAFIVLGVLMGFALHDFKQALIGARDEAEQANQAKSMFLSNMSHEIRTPMNGIDGMLRILEEGENSPDRRHYFSLARNASRSLLNIIDDILELSKIETGAYKFREVDFPTRRVLDEVIEVLSVNAEKKGLDLNLQLRDGLPEFVHGDPDRLKQILFNVVGNAIKYTTEGHVDIRASVAQRRGSWALLHFDVEDTGVGMTEEEQAIIFRPFSQVDSSYAKKYKGTGLGLALSKRLAESMGGGIWCRSRKGVGSTFSFTVWLQLAKQPRVSVTEGQASRQQRPLSILVAEDDRINQVVVRKNLEREGHTVKIVADGRSLLDVLPSVKPHVVLMDVQMPDLDGVETTRRIRSQMPETVRNVPVIALTAYVSDEDQERFLQAGMDAHALKPIDMSALVSVINEVLERKRGSEVDS